MNPIEAVRWSPAGDAVCIIDQRRLPAEYVERELRTPEDVVDAIQTLAVRGAPAIGICGAMGLAVCAGALSSLDAGEFRAQLEELAARIREARPTAVNLAWAVDRVMTRGRATPGAPGQVVAALRGEATGILEEDKRMCRAIGEFGSPLVGEGARVLTHCNAGALATGGMGTALAPVYVAVEQGRRVAVFADETRPLLQGSRLTAWELARAGIPVTVLADNMAASVMRSGSVDICIVGADRIAANGDVANKIGTYGVAVLARHHGIPFYVAAPTSTIDPATATGADIVIEQRDGHEVTRPFGISIAPAGAAVHNPAFDITPAELVTAIITDRGVHRAPYDFRREAIGDWR
ncbi:MAG: S-methyl-5-thioribose-1-phosphate isomerase [Gemmatimonadaceae bacterium]